MPIRGTHRVLEAGAESVPGAELVPVRNRYRVRNWCRCGIGTWKRVPLPWRLCRLRGIVGWSPVALLTCEY